MIVFIRAFGFSTVAPLTGAWIEIVISAPTLAKLSVAPLTGAWIEIIQIGDIPG